MTTPLRKLSSTPPADNANEGTKAQWFREWILNMSQRDVHELTGFSIDHIRNLENGFNPSTEKAPSKVSYLQYRLACAALAADIKFDWRTLKIGRGRTKRLRAKI